MAIHEAKVVVGHVLATPAEACSTSCRTLSALSCHLRGTLRRFLFFYNRASQNVLLSRRKPYSDLIPASSPDPYELQTQRETLSRPLPATALSVNDLHHSTSPKRPRQCINSAPPDAEGKEALGGLAGRGRFSRGRAGEGAIGLRRKRWVSRPVACPDEPGSLATFQAAVMDRFFTQGIGLRPQPWAPFSRPVGPVGIQLPPDLVTLSPSAFL